MREATRTGPPPQPGLRLQELVSRGVHHRFGPVRKTTRILMHVPRYLHRLGDSSAARALAPPVLANSVPKSGTHLLDQIVAALPQRRNYGTFLESMTASYVFRERSEESTVRFIESIVSGEIVRAHLHHSERAERALRARELVHFLIYRDPRDVAVSEAHYLRSMNRWHRLHPIFRRLPSFADAVMLAICGLDASSGLQYPDIARRYRRFLPWLGCPSVHALRFEDLTSERRAEVIADMVRFYARHCAGPLDVGAVTGEAEARIQPSRSHTFRRGERRTWRDVFTPEHERAFHEVAGDLLAELGYAPRGGC